MKSDAGPPETTIIKKYANRRLYDTSSSVYVTLDHLTKLIQDRRDFVVIDARSGDDITRTVLTQIILDKENHKDGVLPVSFLRSLIGFYDGALHAVLPGYLDLSMRSFSAEADRWRETDSDLRRTGFLEEQIRRNIAIFEGAMGLLSSLSGIAPDKLSKKDPAPNAENGAAPTAKADGARRTGGGKTKASQDAIEDLQQQLLDIHRKLDDLTKERGERLPPR